MVIRNFGKIIIMELIVFVFILSACSSKTATRIEREFDEYNRVVKEVTFVQGEMRGTTTYQYGTDGKCSREDHYDENNVLTHYKTFTYNSKGQVIKETLYRDNKMFTESTRQYDDNGLLSRFDTVTHEGAKNYWVYFYDDENKLTESKQYTVEPDGDHIRFWDKFDQAGNKVSSSQYLINGALYSTKVWEYDDEGRTKICTEYDSKGNIKYVTEYDKNGNIKSKKKN